CRRRHRVRWRVRRSCLSPRSPSVARWAGIRTNARFHPARLPRGARPSHRPVDRDIGTRGTPEMATRTIDLLDGELYVRDPHSVYAWMREHAPLYWDPINELVGVSRYDDIIDVEKRKETFINSDQVKGGYRPN